VITGLDRVFAIDSSDASDAKLSERQSVAGGSERDTATNTQLRIVPS
jgi:hypothetical protein